VPVAETIAQPPRRRSRRLIAVAIVVVAAAGATIVLASRSGTGPTPVTLITAAAVRTEGGGTASFTQNISLTVFGRTEPVTTISGASDFATNTSEAHYSAAHGISSTIRYVGGVEYFQSSLIPLPPGAHWVRIVPQDLGATAAQPGSPASGDPTQGLQFLGAAVGNPVVVGHEMLDGVSVTDYKLTLDLADAVAKVGQATTHISSNLAKGIQALAGQVDLAHLPGEVWLDSRGRVRRFDMTISVRADGVPVTEVESMTFSDFGVPVTVVTPAASDTVPFSSVQGEFASLFTARPTAS